MCCVGVLGGGNAEQRLQSPQAVLWHFRGQAAPSLQREPRGAGALGRCPSRAPGRAIRSVKALHKALPRA